MQLVVLEDVSEEVRVLVLGLCEAVYVVQTVQHQPHSGMRDLVLSDVISVTTKVLE